MRAYRELPLDDARPLPVPVPPRAIHTFSLTPLSPRSPVLFIKRLADATLANLRHSLRAGKSPGAERRGERGRESGSHARIIYHRGEVAVNPSLATFLPVAIPDVH